MIGLLTGSVAHAHKNPITLVVHDVGYLVRVPNQLLAQLASQQKATLHIHTHVQDDAIDLYGFALSEELDMFTLLLSISGIGPRTALGVIDKGVSAVQNAIVTADVDFFTTVPRLGRKNAQKIIIELKNKLGSITELDLSLDTPETKQLIDALVSMGFARKEAIEALKKLDGTQKSLEEKIRRMLQIIGKS